MRSERESRALAARARARMAAPLVLLTAAATVYGQDEPMLEEIHVEGTRQDVADVRARAARVPGGVTVVDIGELERRSALSLADALRYVPGVWSASSTGNDDVFFSSRGSNLDATGFDGNGLKLLQDGLPVTTADGNNHNRVIDPLSARAATVARGANGMAYGASTLGGAINFVTPTARDRQGTELRLTGGSHGLGTVRATAAGVFGSRFDGLVTVEGKTWEGYRDHNEQRRHGLYANAGWRPSDTVESRFYGTYLHNDQELSGSLTRSQFADDPNQASADAIGGNFQLDVETWRIANRTSWQLGPGEALDFGLSVERQDLFHPIVDKVLVDFDGTGPLEPVEVFSLLIDTEQRDVGAMLRYRRRINSHDIVLGANYGRNRVWGSHFRNDGGRRNGLSNRIDNDAETWELFVQDHWRLSEPLTLVLALQGVAAERSTRSVDVESGEVEAPKGDYSALNPRIGVLYRLGEGATAYANVSRLYEPPTNFELEDDGRGSDRPLDAMTGRVIEIGTRGTQALGTGGRWHWDMAAYYAWIEDEILSVEDPDAPGTSLASNADDTVHAGVEALLGAELPIGSRARHVLESTVSATLNHFQFDGDPLYGDNVLPAAPDYVVRGEILYRHSSGFYVGPTFDLIGERWADFANTFRIDDHQLLGLRGGWEGRSWRMFIELQNLLDADYVASHRVRTRAPADAALLEPGAPRSVYAGVTVSF